MTHGPEERLRIWDHNARMALTMLRRATDGTHVVIVADTEDPVGKGLFDALAKSPCVPWKSHEEKIRRKGEIPTGIIIVKLEDARQIFTKLRHPGVAKGLAVEPPRGHVRAVIISGGSAMLIHPLDTSDPRSWVMSNGQN